VIVGSAGRQTVARFISSGPSRGRSLIGNIATALGAPENAETAEIEANVELVEALPAALALQYETRRLPTAVVLPAGCCADADRWFDHIEWHTISPRTRAFLGMPADANFEALVRAAYEKFSDCAAAGVAYHF